MMYKIMLPLVAALAAVPAIAQDRPVQVSVQRADLDLGTAAGRATLDRRIAAATETVCGSYAGAIAYEVLAIDACRSKVAADVRSQISGTRLAVR